MEFLINVSQKLFNRNHTEFSITYLFNRGFGFKIMVRRIDKSMLIRLLSTVLLALALILLNLNITAWLSLSNNNTRVSQSFNPSTCFSMYRLISENYEVVQIGRSDTDKYSIDKLVFKYGISNIGNVSIRVDVYKPLVRNYVGRNTILIHDFEQDPRSLTWLTVNLVERGFTVIVPDYRVNILGTGLKVLSRNPYESWIYLTMLSTKKIISYLSKTSSNATEVSINIVGVGFGGQAAVLTGIYDNRVYSSVSIGNVFNIRRSVERGGFTVFYISSLNDIDPCYDPINTVKNGSSRILVVTGLFDEVSGYGEYINEVARMNNVEISVIPGRGRYNEVPNQWLELIMDYLEKRSGCVSCNARIFFNTDIFKTSIHVEGSNGAGFAVLHRPAIPGFSWSVKSVEGSNMDFYDLLVPSEYVVVDRGSYIIMDTFRKGSVIGLITSIVYIPIWVLINKSWIKRVVQKGFFSYAILFLNILIIFYHLPPCFLALGFYHVSTIQLSELLHSYVLFIPYITIFILFSQPVLFVITLLHNDKYKTMYLTVPLLIISIYYAILLYLTTLFEAKITILPTTPLIMIIAAIILYLFKSMRAK